MGRPLPPPTRHRIPCVTIRPRTTPHQSARGTGPVSCRSAEIGMKRRILRVFGENASRWPSSVRPRISTLCRSSRACPCRSGHCPLKATEESQLSGARHDAGRTPDAVALRGDRESQHHDVPQGRKAGREWRSPSRTAEGRNGWAAIGAGIGVAVAVAPVGDRHTRPGKAHTRALCCDPGSPRAGHRCPVYSG